MSKNMGKNSSLSNLNKNMGRKTKKKGLKQDKGQKVKRRITRVELHVLRWAFRAVLLGLQGLPALLHGVYQDESAVQSRELSGNSTGVDPAGNAQKTIPGQGKFGK